MILRSKGRCENPGCTGDIQDVTDNGDAILEIDHVQDLAQGGPDNPVQIIALCPNCHAIKPAAVRVSNCGMSCLSSRSSGTRR